MRTRQDRYAHLEWRTTTHNVTPRSTWNRPAPRRWTILAILTLGVLA